MGKRKRSRSRENDDLRKRLKKLEKIMEERENRPTSPGTPPVPSKTTDEVEELAVDNIPEELLLALGKEGEEPVIVGEDLQAELVNRWSNIIQQGLGRDAKESISKKYPTPANFLAAVPPKMNAEIQATLSESTIKRDKRIVMRQSILGKLMTAIGRALSSILKGNLNTKEIVEQLNDSAKLAAEIYHTDSVSRKFFALAGNSNLIKEAVKNSKSDDYLFGKSCGEQIKAAQAIQRTAQSIHKPRPENWKGPLQAQPQYRSGQPYRQPVKARPNQQAGQWNQPAPRQPAPRQPAPRTPTARKKTQQKPGRRY